MKLKHGKKSGLKYFGIKDILRWGPCYDPTRYLPETWRGTVIDILKLEQVPPEDRLWVVLREDLLSAKTLHLFAVWCAREALKRVKDPDPGSLAACEVAERFAHGQATLDQLRIARDTAWGAAWDAARGAARDVAWGAAWGVAWGASRDASRDASRGAAWGADWDAARGAQISQLIEMARAEGLERVAGKEK